MKIGEWLKRAVTDRAPVAAVQKVQPIVVNPSENERLRIAHYRLDAIRRHITQHEEMGIPIRPERTREFYAETVAHADALYRAEIITQAQHDEAIGFVAARRA